MLEAAPMPHIRIASPAMTGWRIALAFYTLLSTFHHTGVAGPSSTPVNDVRQALGVRNWPSGM